MRRLAPALTVIESSLFDPSPALVRRWVERDPGLSAERRADLDAHPEAHDIAAALTAPTLEPDVPLPGADAEVPPDHIAAMIQARLDAAALGLSTKPVAGLILRIDRARGPEGELDWDLSQPFYVLLSEPTECPDVWHGWLMAGETDYATDWDVVLEEGDAPYDPDAAMIQLWNPVHVYTPAASAAVGRLSAARLAAVRDLAVDLLEARPAGVDPDAGALMQRETVSGYLVVTGTPLADADDPRWRYQELYFEAAGFVRDLARHAIAELAPVATPWWRLLLDRVGAAASDFDLVLEPLLVPDLGEEAEVVEAGPTWRLGALLDLQLIPSPSGDAVQIHVRLRGSEPVSVSLELDGEPRQGYRLDVASPAADLFAGRDERLVLKVRDLDGRELFSAALADDPASPGLALDDDPGSRGN